MTASDVVRHRSIAADAPDQSRQQMIEAYLPLATRLANRFRGRGEPVEDLVQVATIGLIKAVDGYEPSRGTPFMAYAVPTMTGEIKRHFRDRGWHVRVPRRLQELRLGVERVTGDLTQQLGRAPTVAELAAVLDTDEDSIIETRESAHAYRAMSLQAPVASEDAAELGDLIGDVDPRFEHIDNRTTLKPLLARLPRREQRIVAMRFFGNMTQSQIAAELGISQMHVSRLLSGALRTLREGFLPM
jgi:RNA polymerase sigma-B factor